MKKGAGLLAKQAVDKSTADESNRRRAKRMEAMQARALEAKYNEDQERLIAARKAAAMTQQLEAESARLEAALRRKTYKVGVKLRSSGGLLGASPTVDRSTVQAHGATSSSIEHQAPRPYAGLLPPLRVGPGVDF